MKQIFKLKKQFSDCFLMVRYVVSCDRIIIPIKTLAVLLSAVETYVGTVYLKWIIDFITDSLNSPVSNMFVRYSALVFIVQLLTVFIYSLSLILSKIIIPRREYIIKNKLQNLFISKAMQQDLSQYEDYEFYDTYTKTVRYADTKALDIVNMLFAGLESILKIFAVLSVIAQLDPFVLLIVMLMVLLSIIDQRYSNKYSYEQYEAEESINRQSEYIKKAAHHRQYAKEVRIFQLSDFLLDKLNQTFAQKNEIFKSANGKYWRLKYFIHLVNSIIITPFLLIYIGNQMLNGIVSIGSFTVLFSSAFSISAYLSSVIMHIDKLRFESDFYISKLKKMLETSHSIENEKQGLLLDKIESICFCHVYFKYPHHERWILEDVSFQINKKEHVALVGKNGAGKSTIIKLILRLYDVSDGEIQINGVNIKQYNIVSLRDAFSVVLQDYQIFNFSIKDNLCLGKTVQDPDIKNALSFVELQDRINNCKNGISTYIGRDFDPSGENFSGGELQRIAIARGQIKNCMCYIWDEANSSLDPFAEFAINKKVIEKNTDKTMIIVTHRLTTAVNVSKIIHIEEGKIVSVGNHISLLKNDILYRQMFDCQNNAYKAHMDNLPYE